MRNGIAKSVLMNFDHREHRGQKTSEKNKELGDRRENGDFLCLCSPKPEKE